jgi:hypothetical protein
MTRNRAAISYACWRTRGRAEAAASASTSWMARCHFPDSPGFLRNNSHSRWVGTRRVALRYVSSSPRLAPCMRLSPHTAQHLWSFSMDLHEASVPIAPAPQCMPRGQLARALGTFVPIFPKARGLRLQSSSWRAQLSWTPTPMPPPTPVRTSGISLGSRFPPLHCPSHSSQISRVHHEGLKQNAVGGVWLNAPSPLWGSPTFLQGSIRLTWSPRRSHPGE